MKKIENSFVVSGFVGKDASIHQFSTASVARFSLAISRTEKNGEETNRISAFMNVEAWRKNENTSSFDRLVKGTLLTVEGYFKPEEWQDAQPCGSRRNQILRSCGERRNSCSTGEQDKEGQITFLVIKERPSGRFFCVWGSLFPYRTIKFALYPTFSLPLCIYFKNIA